VYYKLKSNQITAERYQHQLIDLKYALNQKYLITSQRKRVSRVR